MPNTTFVKKFAINCVNRESVARSNIGERERENACMYIQMRVDVTPLHEKLPHQEDQDEQTKKFTRLVTNTIL